ncbi:MAG: class GN sortase [Candidatus Thiodiazotropha taylori]|nr:class GN sortase [Candidatus Thiodiazotropha taylori]MCW4325676.1 class GN sortase [Candidatus Thiodiazotropha taylori]
MGLRVAQTLALLMALLGGGMLANGLWIEAKAWLAEGLITVAWQRTRNGQSQVTPWPWADTWPVARLVSPRLGVSRLVLSGDSGATLAFGPGWAEQSTLPGGVGRSFVSGHRDTHFRFLKDLQIGDILKLQGGDGREMDYRVVEHLVVDQRAGWQIPLTGPQELLLITCFPFDALMPGGPLRYIVRAEITS